MILTRKEKRKLFDSRRYNERKRLGLCVRCGCKKEKNREKFTVCLSCRKRRQQTEYLYNQRKIVERRKEGMCTRCGKKKDVPGYTCTRCRERSKIIKRERKRLGICERCQSKVKYPYTLCERHLLMGREKCRVNNKITKEIYIKENRCTRCGHKKTEDVDDGHRCCINCRERITRTPYY